MAAIFVLKVCCFLYWLIMNGISASRTTIVIATSASPKLPPNHPAKWSISQEKGETT